MHNSSLYTHFSGSVTFKEEQEVDVLKAVTLCVGGFFDNTLCVGGVPEWRHLIHFLPGEYHDRPGKNPSVDKPCYTLH